MTSRSSPPADHHSFGGARDRDAHKHAGAHKHAMLTNMHALRAGLISLVVICAAPIVDAAPERLELRRALS